MTNLDSILKSRDIILPTKVHLVKAMVFPVVIHGCESWTIKRAERQRIDALELWCWTGPQDGPDVAPITWSSQPSRERVEESRHTTEFSSKAHMISSTRAVGRVWENFPEKGILKLKSEGVTKHSRVGDGSLKHEANWVSRE